MANFLQESLGNDIANAYINATKLAPIKKSEKDKVLTDYGIKVGWATGKSDAAISAEAAAKVLAKFKADQAKANTPKPTPTAPGTGTVTPKPPTGSAGGGTPTTRPGGYAPPSGSAGGGSSVPAVGMGGATLPDTAMKPPSNKETSTLTKVPPSPAQVSQMLASAGLAGAKPPSYALLTTADLAAWINRVKANQAAAQKAATARATATRLQAAPNTMPHTYSTPLPTAAPKVSTPIAKPVVLRPAYKLPSRY